MVFHFVSGLLSLLTSSIVYLVGAFIFANSTLMLAEFILALFVIMIVIGISRVIFSPSGRGMRSSMHGMYNRGYSMRRVAFLFKRTMERQVISGSVARISAFGIIYFLLSENIFVVYVAGIAIIASSLFSLLSHRHHFVDIITGFLLGAGAGFLSVQFTPLLMSSLGF